MAPRHEPDGGNDTGSDERPDVDLRDFEDQAGHGDDKDHLKDSTWSHGPKSMIRRGLLRDGRSGAGTGVTVRIGGCGRGAGGEPSMVQSAITLTKAIEPRTIIRNDARRLSAYSLVRASTL